MGKHSLMRILPVAVVAAVCAGGVVASRVRAEGDGGGKFKAAAQAAFAQADADGSGDLSATEFANFHEILRREMETLRFTKLDTDGNGARSWPLWAADVRERSQANGDVLRGSRVP